MNKPVKEFGGDKGDGLPAVQRAGIDTVAAGWIIASFVVAGYMIFTHLGLLPLMNPDEGRNASIAWEMQMSGHWLIPTYNGLPYLDKPSLFFKVVAISLSLFGHNEFAARLPSALSSIGILIMVFLFCRREYNLRTAAIAVLIVSTTPLFFAFSRIVIFDMFLTFFVCASIFAGYFAERVKGRIRKRWYIIYALMAGIATLVKGPVGFVLPILVLTIFNYLDGRKGAIRRLLSWGNFLILLGVVLPWFVGVSILRPDFPYYGLVKEVFLRFTTNTFNRSGPFYYYLPIIFGTFIFWSLLLPETAVVFYRQRRRMSSADRLLSVWGVSVIIFFSLSNSKLPGYILTAIIALGILMARIFDVAMKRGGKAEANTVGHGSLYLSILSVIFGVALIVVYISPELIDTWLRHIRNPAVVKSFHSLILPLIFLSAGTAILATIGTVYSNIKAALSAFLLFPLFIPSLILPHVSPILSHRSDRSLAAEVSRLSRGAEVACFRCFPNGLPFYLERTVTLFTGRRGSEMNSNYISFYLSRTAVWPQHIRSTKDFKPWLTTLCKPVFLIVEGSQKQQLDAILGNHHRTMQYLGCDSWGELLAPQGEG